MHLSSYYFTETATCASIGVNQLVLLDVKLPNEMLNVKNDSEGGKMSNISGNQNCYNCLFTLICRIQDLTITKESI